MPFKKLTVTVVGSLYNNIQCYETIKTHRSSTAFVITSFINPTCSRFCFFSAVLLKKMLIIFVRRRCLLLKYEREKRSEFVWNKRCASGKKQTNCKRKGNVFGRFARLGLQINFFFDRYVYALILIMCNDKRQYCR